MGKSENYVLTENYCSHRHSNKRVNEVKYQRSMSLFDIGQRSLVGWLVLGLTAF